MRTPNLIHGGRVLTVLLLAIAGLSRPLFAQDTAAVARQRIVLDVTRLRPFERHYDVLVHGLDSARLVSRRVVTLQAASYADSAAWLLTENRDGAVLSADSLFVSLDARPLHRSARLGIAHIVTIFVGDSMMTATNIGGAADTLLMLGRPDVLVSPSMAEMILALAPLDTTWIDSAAVLELRVGAAAITPAEWRVIGVEDLPVNSAGARSTWRVALRAGAQELLYWVDRESGAVLRSLQPLPSHVGMRLEFRLRADVPPPAALQ